MDLMEMAAIFRERDDGNECKLNKAINGMECCSFPTCGECRTAMYRTIADAIEEAMKPNAALERLCERLDYGSPHDQRIAERIRGAAGQPESAGSDVSRDLPRGVNMPMDADGEPCLLDDAVWHKGDKYAVVAVSHKGKVCIRDWYRRENGSGGRWVEAKRVTHCKPDTQEALQADVEEWVRKMPDGCRSMDVFAFMARQRKLMGGE